MHASKMELSKTWGQSCDRELQTQRCKNYSAECGLALLENKNIFFKL
jgi:hypothetical protein